MSDYAAAKILQDRVNELEQQNKILTTQLQKERKKFQLALGFMTRIIQTIQANLDTPAMYELQIKVNSFGSDYNQALERLEEKFRLA